MVTLIALIPALPLLGAVLLLLGRKALGRVDGWIASSSIGLSFVLSLTAFGEIIQREAEDRSIVARLYEWVVAGGFTAPVQFRVDPLTAVMLLVITGVGTLIHVYSMGYMAHDSRRTTYFGYLNLFAASMLILVLADNFLLMFVGWELVGLCSYLLISFWYDRPSAAAAGKKAFIVNRIGDFAFLIGMFLIWRAFGSIEFEHVLLHGHPVSGALVTWIPLLLFIGATGKSAQIPLYVWLPDAMEGPTPVSALIHAATMVTAGVYLIVRAHVLFEAAPAVAAAVAMIGAATALLAALIATAQDDIKKVLAYSTVSQLGYMFLAAGIGAWTHSPVAYVAAIFHLVTHAFFKALLFLGAGSVMHALDNETDMKKMGGLRAALPVTSATFMIAWLAIMGIPPFAGFFSKDAVLAVTFESGKVWLWAVGLLVAGLTAFYMSRQVFLVFFGRSRVEPDVHPHESPSVMTNPLAILAGLAAVGGLMGLTLKNGRLFTFLRPVVGEQEHHAELPFNLSEPVLATIAVAVALVGLGIAWRMYLAPKSEERREKVKSKLGPLVGIVRNRFYIDEAYGALFVWPLKTLAATSAFVFDARIIDGAVNGVGGAISATAMKLRKVQSGQVRRYAAAMLFGIVALLALMIGRVS